MMLRPWLLLGAVVYATSSQTCFDYIILGGGTCGLVLANRLSANPNVSVAVIEAGDSVYNNSNVTQIDNYFMSLGTSIDWQYQTLPQKYTSNRTLTYDQGKAIGGTSTINGATYVRAQKAQIDAWQALGNTGWDWDALWPYYLKSERLETPTPELVAKGVAYTAAYHGYSGPLSVGWGNTTIGGDVHSIVNQTWQNVGVPYSRDQAGGELHGFSMFPSTIDSAKSIRADAARSYYWPIAAQRKNLLVFANTLAEKIIWTDSAYESKVAVASGVQIRSIQGGQLRTLTANKEVIVSAGSLKSPVILENSGIGNPLVLSQHQVPVKVNLPAVGENLQDQPNIVIQANTTSNTTWNGYTPYISNVLASELFGKNVSAVTTYVQNKIAEYASAIAAESNNAMSPDLVEKQLRIQADLIFNKSTPIAEILTVPQSTSVLAAYWGLLPFSRGNVHMSSTNASTVPLINPNFFMIDLDEMVSAATGNLIRKVFHTAPLGDAVGPDSVPDEMTVRRGARLDEWSTFLKEKYTPNSHPVGTCAMMAREMGGVVSPELRVYGTANVRVVDASILPFQIDGHLTSTLYAVSERAADIIIGRV